MYEYQPTERTPQHGKHTTPRHGHRISVVTQDVRAVYSASASETRCPVLGPWRALMDPNVTIELKIRRRLDNIFNKQRDEFSDKKTYDDYLEEKETYVFNLLLGEAVAETEAKIAEYIRVNQDSITRNRAAQSGVQNSANADAAVTVASAAPTAAAQPPQGYVPTARHSGPSALPVPTIGYTEGERGLKVDRSGLPVLTKEGVAAASGWSRRAALLKAFNSAKQFWC